MDFLDSLDLDISNRKSDRVRSWYLYEQFKSLERNQLEAAQKLKDKSYQDRILHQELSERRARRKIYDQFGLCESKSRIERRIKSAEPKSSQTVISSDDLFESYCELHEDYENSSQATEVGSSQDAFSQDGSLLDRPLSEDFKSIEESKDGTSYAGSVNSVVQISENSKNLADDAKERARANIAQSLTKQLESVKEDIQCIENLTHLSDSKSIDDDSVVTFPNTKSISGSKNYNEYDIFAIWSKLVSFAYQVVQLNHGNCYNDYSSQLMTAVLACDMLRRGVNRMCHILQPYVSPIKFASDDFEDSIEIHKNAKRKNSIKNFISTKHKKSSVSQLQRKNKVKTVKKQPRFGRSYQSDHWRPRSRKLLENFKNKYRRASEPVRTVSKSLYNGHTSERSSYSIWPKFSKENIKKDCCNCWCNKRVHNPSVQMARYIDSILKDIDDAYV
ncbi:hypothetical protein K1T71_007049 [Dendrolimus kikuchii]|uniref:Uncharacterized protein n=1 Tax=Dendrolimus kikuchii TaxID=765133 RepID=A0ACC1CZP0_9NEOP|nr:hypothetical protein K1T71_007049 [Dendrolimus kikuchii]